jgi:glucan phosphoethanolaminetransferase (alkaline phosphatase superfamily)
MYVHLPALLLLNSMLILSLRIRYHQGWREATFIVPLLISIALLVGCFFWEMRLPPDRVSGPATATKPSLPGLLLTCFYPP